MAALGTQPHTVLGEYELLGEIGAGGMASVYRARHRGTGREVAVKVLKADIARDPVLCRRFEAEFAAARAIDHPHVVRGLDFGVARHTPFFVMEYVRGESLGAVIERRGRLPEAEAVAIAAQVAAALDRAHGQDIIHRDVKPDNILLTADGCAKLTDFGLAKSPETGGELTLGNEGFGTPHFMAPEQYEDARGVDCRADVYGLGATLYVAVTGRLPFLVRGRQNHLAVLKKQLTNDLTPPRALAPGLSERTDLAVRRALRADRGQRFASCGELAAALTGGRAERRRAARHEAAHPASCEPVALVREVGCGGRVADISTNGIRVVLYRRFEPGTVLLLAVDSGGGVMPPGRVVRAARGPGGLWALGCEFTPALSADELRRLV